MARKIQLLSDVYDCAVNPDRWNEVLDNSLEITGAKGAVLMSIPADSALDSGWSLNFASDIWRQVPPAQMRFMAENYYQYEKEAWHFLTKLEALKPLPDNEAYDDPEKLDQREDYVYLKEHMGILRKVGVRLNSNLGWFDTAAFQFDEKLKVISPESVNAVNFLTPHLSKSLELSHIFNSLRQRYDAVLSALDHVDIGLCIVNRDQNIVATNKEASRIFSETAVISANIRGKLCCSQDELGGILENRISEALDAAASSMNSDEQIIVLDDKIHHPVFVSVCCLRDSGAELGEILDAALVTIVDLAKAQNYDLERLAKLYLLSDSEKTVASLLIQGGTIREIAEQRSVSPETIKTQVKSVYSKTSASNRVELLNLVIKATPPIVD